MKGKCAVDYLAVLDFEATCDDMKPGVPRFEPQEIIELPVMLLNTRTLEIDATFHVYCKPQVHPRLTAFCTELTGITQTMVDAGVPFVEAIKSLQDWMHEQGLLDDNYQPYEASNRPSNATAWSNAVKAREQKQQARENKQSSSSDGKANGTDSKEGKEQRKATFLWCTCGDWDLKTMLPMQMALLRQKVPSHFNRWANVKRLFDTWLGSQDKKLKQKHTHGMLNMLEAVGLQLEGRHHSGIDDVHNIARVLAKMLEGGATVEATWPKTERPANDREGQQATGGRGRGHGARGRPGRP